MCPIKTSFNAGWRSTSQHHLLEKIPPPPFAFSNEVTYCILTYVLLEGSTHAVTNSHRHSGLKQHNCIILQFWRPEVQNVLPWAKTKVPTVLCAFGRLEGRTVSSPFPGAHVSRPMAPSFVLTWAMDCEVFLTHVTLTLALPLPSFTNKELSD